MIQRLNQLNFKMKTENQVIYNYCERNEQLAREITEEEHDIIEKPFYVN